MVKISSAWEQNVSSLATEATALRGGPLTLVATKTTLNRS